MEGCVRGRTLQRPTDNGACQLPPNPQPVRCLLPNTPPPPPPPPPPPARHSSAAPGRRRPARLPFTAGGEGRGPREMYDQRGGRGGGGGGGGGEGEGVKGIIRTHSHCIPLCLNGFSTRQLPLSSLIHRVLTLTWKFVFIPFFPFCLISKLENLLCRINVLVMLSDLYIIVQQSPLHIEPVANPHLYILLTVVTGINRAQSTSCM